MLLIKIIFFYYNIVDILLNNVKYIMYFTGLLLYRKKAASNTFVHYVVSSIINGYFISNFISAYPLPLIQICVPYQKREKHQLRRIFRGTFYNPKAWNNN